MSENQRKSKGSQKGKATPKNILKHNVVRLLHVLAFNNGLVLNDANLTSALLITLFKVCF